jgi:3-oxoacyl-[acyl-carrier-protein] synthase-1
MAPSQTIHIVGFGAVTPVGASPAVAMAAAQADLSGMILVPDKADPDATNVARITTLADEDEPGPRAKALLRLAIAQALAPVAGRGPGPLGAWVAGPSLCDALTVTAQAVAGRLRVAPLGAESTGGHGSSALLALEKAVAALRVGSIDLALVAGVDVRTHEAAVAAAVKAGRAIGPNRRWGYVPGEAAAAVLLASEQGLRRSALRALATLTTVASGHETVGSAAPCVGRGLTDVVRRALEVVPPDQTAARVFCDLNGERHRSDEWGFTVCRVGRRLRDPSAFVAPSVAWGDCGAVNGLLLLALSVSAGARAGIGDTYSLVWTSSDGSERAAAIVRSVAAPPGGHPDPGDAASLARCPHPAWAAELDAEMIATMLDESSFRFEQRAYQLAAMTDDPPANFAPIERTEDTMDALAIGLAECGTHALTLSEGAANPEFPGTVYTAVRVLLEAGRSRQAIAWLTPQLVAQPGLAPVILEAFLHTRRANSPADDRVAALWEADTALRWLSLRVSSAMGVSPGAARLAKLSQALPPERELEFLTALGRIGPADFRPYLARWERAPTPLVRQEAALTEALLGRALARQSLLARVQTDPALLLPASLLVDASQAPRLLGMAKAAPSGDTLIAVAMAGDATALPWLLEQLDNGENAIMAAAALEILLGKSCFEEYEVPDPEEGAPPSKARRVSCARKAWEPIARQVLAAHPRHLRLCAGGPATAASVTQLLERPHLPFLARRMLGAVLAVRWGGPRTFDPTLTVRSQKQWLAQVQGLDAALPAGSWAMARQAVE